jgi:ribosome-associated translation inhibitor RaiA
MSGIQITLRNLPRSTVLHERIRKMNDHLHDFHPRILATRVTVEGPGLHPHRGREFTVDISLQVPGHEIVASHSDAHDVYSALSGAFAAARRQLLDASKAKHFTPHALLHQHTGTNEK